MSDLIDRQAAIDRIEEHIRFGDELYPLTETDRILNHAFEIAASCVYNLPSAERKKGEWLLVKGSNGKDYHKCSQCLHTQEITGVKNYCAVCGAEMRGEEE